MASQLLSAVKYTLLAAIAFTGPKWITDSGKYLARVEKRIPSVYHHKKSLLHAENLPDSKENPHTEENPDKEKSAETVPPPVPEADSKPQLSENFSVFRPAGAENHSGPEAVSLPVQEHSIPIVPLEQAVRFDLLPGSIIALWPNVTADDSTPPSRGYRVPLLTGTASDDLAGALCYWYGRQRLDRITFTGQTGDFRKILSFLEYRYGMTLDDDSGPREFRYHSTISRPSFHRGPVSRLTIQPSAQFDAARPNRNFTVTFELIRPD